MNCELCGNKLEIQGFEDDEKLCCRKCWEKK